MNLHKKLMNNENANERPFFRNIKDARPKIKNIVEVKSINDYDILLIGLAGAGKTSLMSLMHEGNTSNGFRSYESQTKEFSQPNERIILESDNKSIAVKFIDSPGIGDSTMNSEEYLKKMINQIRIISKISYVFILIPITRIAKTQINMIEEILRELSKYGMQDDNLVILLTKMDFYSEKYIENAINEMKNKVKSLGIIKSVITPACFVYSEDLLLECQELADNRVTDTYNSIKTILFRNVRSFYPSKVHLDVQQNAFRPRSISQENDDYYYDD